MQCFIFKTIIQSQRRHSQSHISEVWAGQTSFKTLNIYFWSNSKSVFWKDFSTMSVIASKKIMGVLAHLWQWALFSISREAEPLGELTVWGVGLADRVISEQPQNIKHKNTRKQSFFKARCFLFFLFYFHFLFMTDIFSIINILNRRLVFWRWIRLCSKLSFGLFVFSSEVSFSIHAWLCPH